MIKTMIKCKNIQKITKMKNKKINTGLKTFKRLNKLQDLERFKKSALPPPDPVRKTTGECKNMQQMSKKCTKKVKNSKKHRISKICKNPKIQVSALPPRTPVGKNSTWEGQGRPTPRPRRKANPNPNRFVGWCCCHPSLLVWCCLPPSPSSTACPSPSVCCCHPSLPLGGTALSHVFFWVVLSVVLLIPFLLLLSWCAPNPRRKIDDPNPNATQEDQPDPKKGEATQDQEGSRKPGKSKTKKEGQTRPKEQGNPQDQEGTPTIQGGAAFSALLLFGSRCYS